MLPLTWTLLWEKPHEATDCNYQEALVHCISVSSKEDTAFQSQTVFTSVRFAFFVNTDISRSLSRTPWVFRMPAISVCLVSLKTVLTLWRRRQYMSSCDGDNVVCSDAGCEEARRRERRPRVIPLLFLCAAWLVRAGVWAQWTWLWKQVSEPGGGGPHL